MAAQAATPKARGLREVGTLCLTLGAGLEVAGAVEPEDEDEDEDEAEAAARRARSFARDPRVRFLGGLLQQVLRLREEKWSQYLENEDNRRVLGEFVNSASPSFLLFGEATAGRLAASREVRGDRRGTCRASWGSAGRLENSKSLPWDAQTPSSPRAPTLVF